MSSRELPEIVNALAGLFRGLSVSCVVQVGAGDGWEAEAMKDAIGCRAVSIDGDIRQKPFRGMEWHHALIGATDGPMPFYMHTVADLSSPFRRNDPGQEECHTVQQYRLDTFCGERNIAPDALIIDTEGSTLDVLEGCGKLLDGVKVIYAEVQSYPLRAGIRPVGMVDEFLTPLGFTQHRTGPTYGLDHANYNMTWVRK